MDFYTCREVGREGEGGGRKGEGGGREGGSLVQCQPCWEDHSIYTCPSIVHVCMYVWCDVPQNEIHGECNNCCKTRTCLAGRLDHATNGLLGLLQEGSVRASGAG